MMTLLAASLLLTGCQNPTVSSAQPQTIYDFTMTDIDGNEVLLNKFRGKVVVVTNVASKCGLTPQYKGLEALYRENKDKGLVVLGFPANNFKGQEPGTNEEIKEFCSLNYDVTFPMFSKISVQGDDTHPLYKWLLANSDRHEDIEWNFAKFVVGRDGKVVKRLSPKDTPESEAMKSAVSQALAAKP